MKWLQELVKNNESEIVQNPFTKEEVLLCPEAVAVYDYIKGCEYLQKDFSEALSYFRDKWPKEYLILLD